MKSETSVPFPAGPLPKGDMRLYRQVTGLVRDAILSGSVVVGESLPTEHELASRFGVSRVTVRQALKLLENEGLIQRRPGKGTIVISQVPAAGDGWEIGSLGDVVAFGSHTKLRIDSYRREHDAEIGRLLRLAEDQLCWVLRGRRLLEHRPFGCTEIYLPPTIGGRLTRRDFDRATVFLTLQLKLGIALTEAQQEVSAHSASAELANLLDCAVGTPILTIRRLYLTSEGTPVEYAVSHYLGFAFSLKYRLRQVSRSS